MFYLIISSLLTPPTLAAESFEGRRFFLGDLHVHTGASGDGQSSDMGRSCEESKDDCGAVADLVETAKANSLDFMAVADHINGDLSLTNEDDFYTVYQEMIAGHDPDNEFITVPAVELHWSYANGDSGGHRNLYLFGDNAQLEGLSLTDVRFDGEETDITACEGIWSFMDHMTKIYGPALLLPHHMTAFGPMQGDWSCHHPDYAPAAEIYSEHGNSLHPNPDFDPLLHHRAYQEGTSMHDGLNPRQYAHKIGFYGSTDNHLSVPGGICTVQHGSSSMVYGGGLAVVVQDEAESFSRLSIKSAMSNRRTYATSGPFIPIVAEYFAGGSLVGEMGDELDVPVHLSLQAQIRLPAEFDTYIDEVVIVAATTASGEEVTWQNIPMEGDGNGTYTYTFDGTGPPVFYPMVIVDGEAWWDGQGCEDGGLQPQERIWLSPAWVNRVIGPADSTDVKVLTATGSGEDTGEPEALIRPEGEDCSTCPNQSPVSVVQPVVRFGCDTGGQREWGFLWLLMTGLLGWSTVRSQENRSLS